MLRLWLLSFKTMFKLKDIVSFMYDIFVCTSFNVLCIMLPNNVLFS